MPIFTKPEPIPPVKLARAQIERELTNALDSGRAIRDRLYASIFKSETGATPEEIATEFGEDWKTLLDVVANQDAALKLLTPDVDLKEFKAEEAAPEPVP